MIGVWNVRGFNNSLKQLEVANLVALSKLKAIGLLEVRVRKENRDRVRNSLLLHGWELVCYEDSDSSLDNIWVLFNKKGDLFIGYS